MGEGFRFAFWKERDRTPRRSSHPANHAQNLRRRDPTASSAPAEWKHRTLALRTTPNRILLHPTVFRIVTFPSPPSRHVSSHPNRRERHAGPVEHRRRCGFLSTAGGDADRSSPPPPQRPAAAAPAPRQRRRLHMSRAWLENQQQGGGGCQLPTPTPSKPNQKPKAPNPESNI